MDNRNYGTQPRFNTRMILIILAIALVAGLIFIIMTSCLGISLWGTGRLRAAAAANATKTSQADQANAAATQVGSLQGQFEFEDQFNDNLGGWLTEKADDEYYEGRISIEEGVYKWVINESKQGFSYSSLRSIGSLLDLNDFDLSVDAKGGAAAADGPCYGLEFRQADSLYTETFYTFEVCDTGEFGVFFYSYEDGSSENNWTTLHQWNHSSAFRQEDWNSLEVQARGSHFSFYINDEKVADLDDERAAGGEMGVFIDVYEGQQGTVLFDNYYVHGR